MSGHKFNLKPNYTFKRGQYFQQGWQIFQQYMWQFIGFTTLVIVISGFTARLPYPLGINEDGQGGIINGILSPVLVAGIYIVALKIAKNRTKTFSDFFLGFNNFLPIFLVNLVGSILTILGCILLIIPGIYLAVAYVFGICFVIEKHFGFWSALETSRKIITKKWFAFFGFILLLGLLNLGGLLVLGVGLLVTIPLTVCIIVAAFEDIVGLNVADTQSLESEI
ncbi:hypothetical protein Sta7437_2131 [Stanieria cyanosphaera PCC 7437]|uniref:Glycerophosphoryl diester phosphodiesterase membrane domain-containing protein n=1 Tax=Stanieria cyanosphaera (strain ATCC 29371 / PCC 7437) TaxID=111780 RepID=K9XUC7_STAC7|nr:hypothetical protein [Stanieria cyanosphaera]AFZ35681.1 hypothetical protein Sta7437_2131 [Stanieria cyanosphaera PCC 7437]